MARPEMQRVYRALLKGREQGAIPWHWIVDETRTVARAATWRDPADYARTVAHSYRRDFWTQQPIRLKIWSEKGSVRGVLAPILREYAVSFRVLHGFSGATTVHSVCEYYDGRKLVILYVGDFDPSGLFMSEVDLPNRFAKYGGDHIELKRVALTPDQLNGLPSFPATDKTKDTRYRWFRDNHGGACWELDAMDPRDLRACVETAIRELIEPVAWGRCEVINLAEQELLRTILQGWGS